MRLVTSFIIVILLATACEPADEVSQKKKELAAAKQQMLELQARIAQLEQDLQALGALENHQNLTRVSVYEVQERPFTHYVDVRGTVRSRNNVVLSAESPAVVKEIPVVEGQEVRKGDILVVQDGEILRKNIEELKSSLALARTIYERQKKLWEQNIGTEVQYLEAKNRLETLQLKLETTQTQLAKTRIKAPFNGIVDEIMVRVGEIAQPGMPVIRLVSMANMYISAEVSESFVGKFRKGQPVEVYFPSIDYKVKSTIAAIGQVINPENRTFQLEIRLPVDRRLKPNMIAVVTLADYHNPRALVVPSRIIQTDRLGQFLFRIVEEEGATKVKRTAIETGVTAGNETEIIKGLLPGDKVVLDGGIGLADGMLVEVVSSEEPMQ
ncbi:MAG TPA: efflux RND transporter periplasmic adaptor subunit [Flammeovirgaceae bacterium]|nr:efflux RND transporter periplasmic adaptor subunit [Flammeovirgaceae bacterium]